MTNKKKSEKTPKEFAQKDGLRETVESIVIAFVFAFLFRTFEAEAFVIPTGSMAPTLFGRHKDVDCEACGYHFQVGASHEMNDNQDFQPSERIHTAFCPNCRYKNDIRELSAFSGDRILVNKFPYEIGDPQRWDVPVFKYPENPGTNFIKRLVGMPGETIRIRQGNVFAKKNDKDGWHILRKDNPNKQRAIQILVYNNDYRPTKLLEKGWPECWAAVTKKNTKGHIAGWSKDESGWKTSSDKKGFQLSSLLTKDGQFRWIRYRHFVPQLEDWNYLKANPSQNQKIVTDDVKPRLITDYCAYNAIQPNNNYEFNWAGWSGDSSLYWNGEVTLDAEFIVSNVNQEGELLLELNQGARKFHCRFDLTTGIVTLSYETGLSTEGDDEKIIATTTTSVKGVGTYRVSFTNVDNRLCLWVNDSLVDFGDKKGEYLPLGGIGIDTLPENNDLIPIGIAAKGIDASVSHLVIRRDIYYRANFIKSEDQYNADPRKREQLYECDRNASNPTRSHFNPTEYGRVYQKYALWRSDSQGASVDDYELKLDEGEYLMLGDNSPASSDSRLWGNTRYAKHRYAVPREAFVGKAFYIYWPHGIPFMNNGKGFTISQYEKSSPDDNPYPKYSAPFYPNFKRMRKIR